jgi:hypothetical protein
MNQSANQPVIVTCQCGQKFRARADLAGKRLPCLRGGGPIDVPSPPVATGQASSPANDAWEDLGAAEKTASPLTTGPRPLPATGYSRRTTPHSIPSWLFPAGVAVAVLGILCLFAFIVTPLVSWFSPAAPETDSGQAPEWATFAHPSGGFSIAMPGRVLSSDRPTPEAAGFCSRVLDAYSHSSDGILASVNLCVGVAPSAEGVPSDQRYAERLYASQPDVVSNRVEMFDRPGLELKGTMQKDGKRRWVCSRVILLDDRLYELSLQNESAEALAADQVDAFFASFQPSAVNEWMQVPVSELPR